MELPLAILTAVILDFFNGDPRNAFHPVALLGKLISMIDRALTFKNNNGFLKKIIGVVFLITFTALSSLIVWFTLRLSSSIGADFPIMVYWIWVVISPKSLKKAGRQVALAILDGNMSGSRILLSGLVSRETKNMESDQIVRSTIESVAENTVDGVIAPLFYAAVGGPVLAVVYRTVNTLDSMIGYKDNRYIDLGWASARFDDLLNYVPARIARYILALSSFLITGGWANALKVSFADGSKHPSPNSGIPEAAMAGALGVSLGGPAVYNGKTDRRQYLGDGGPPSVFDLLDAIRIMEVATLITAVLAVILASNVHS